MVGALSLFGPRRYIALRTNGVGKSENRIQRRFLNSFGQLRKKYSRYQSLALVGSIIDYLHQGFDLNDVDHLRKAPWVQLLVVQWILTDPDFGRRKLVATPDQVLEILNAAWSLTSKGRLPSEYPSIQLFMRGMAFQQFPYQEPLALEKIGRQWALFADLPEDSYLERTFRETFDLGIKDFLSLSFLLSARLIKNPVKSLRKEYFGPVAEEFGEGVVAAFLDSLSAKLPDVRVALKVETRGTRHPQELMDYSPLSRWPLIVLEDSYLTWYPTLLFRRLETFVYDSLKTFNAARFMDKFGPIFESYVDRAIGDSGSDYLREKDLIPLLDGGKCVDFIIDEGDCVVLVDAKAVEMSVVARSTPNPGLVRDRTKGTLLKAIEQSHSVWSKKDRLPLKKSCGDIIPYVMIVTFKEHYLGNGLKYSMAVADADIQRIQAAYGGASIPLENIYFLTIDDLDYLSEGVRRGRLSYSEALRHAVASDEDPKTAKFTFTQSIRELELGDKPARVKECVDQLMARLERPLMAAEKQT